MHVTPTNPQSNRRGLPIRWRRWTTVATHPVLAGAALGLVAALAAAAPVLAHGGDAPDATNYRTEVTGVTPAVAGVTVRIVEAGAQLELTNRSGRTVEVLGYDGEPYLEVRPDGVFQNVRSPATYLNATLSGGTEPPAEADSTAPPSWRRLIGDPVVRWHDHRAHWMSSATPPRSAPTPAGCTGSGTGPSRCAWPHPHRRRPANCPLCRCRHAGLDSPAHAGAVVGGRGARHWRSARWVWYRPGAAPGGRPDGCSAAWRSWAASPLSRTPWRASWTRARPGSAGCSSGYLPGRCGRC